MIFLMADPYDASETEERPRSTYVGKKDWKILAIFLIPVSIVIWMLYSKQLKQAQEAICDQNLAQIQKAMGVYMETNNGRFPPAFVETSDHQPMMIQSGRVEAPHTWISQIYGGFEKRASFVCPSALAEEYASNLHPEETHTTINSTYGMYLPRSGWPESLLQNPEQAILIAETSNHGSNSSFNPKPYPVAPDGSVIGWDDGNVEMTPNSRFATRLAFQETTNGKFQPMGPARHETRIHVLFASGRRGRIQSEDARIEKLGEQSTGYWADR